MLETLPIPDNLEACQQQLRALAEAHAQLQRVHEQLLDTCTSMQDAHEKLDQERDELRLTIQCLMHQLYGRRSERRKEAEGQRHLDFNDGETAVPDAPAEPTTPDEQIIAEHHRRRQRPKPRRSEQLPAHFERRTVRIEPALPAGVKPEDCQLIGVDVVEALEFDCPKPWVRRIEYPKYKLPASVETGRANAEPGTEEGQAGNAGIQPSAVSEVSTEDKAQTEHEVPAEIVSGAAQGVHAEQGTSGQQDSSGAQPARGREDASEEHPRGEPQDTGAKPSPSVTTVVVPAVVEPHGILQAPREVTLIPGGRFGFGVATEVLFSKFVLHVPLYRQQDMWAQWGWSPSRSTLGQIVTTSAELLAPLADFFRQRVLATSVIGTDDTPVTLLTPGVGEGSRQARFWMYRGRDTAPYNVFAFTDNRTREGPDRYLESFRGTIIGDCYSGYVNIEKVTCGRIRFSACLTHARRKVFDARQQQPALSSQILALLGELYDIEERAKTGDDAGRLALRQRESVPVMARLKKVLDGEAANNVLPKSRFGEALRYLRGHWAAFQLFLGDGRLPIDNNDVEREFRRVAIGRKNWLFVGSQAAGERMATILGVIASAHRHDLEVWAYLRDVLERLARGAADLEALLPDMWKAAHPEHVRTFREQEKQIRAAERRYRRACRRQQRTPPPAR